MDKCWFLSKVDIFQDLNEHEIKTIGDRIPMQTVDPGTVFYSPEQPMEVLFILKQGRVRLFRLSPGGKAFTTAIVSPGTIFGEMALMGQRMHDHFAEALDPCRICLMGKEDTQRLLLSDPRIAARIAGILSDRLKDMEERLSDFAFKNVAQRIASTLLAIERNDRARGVLNGVCEVRMTHEQLAEFVGTYRETVTKVLNELRDQNLIELRRGKILLIDTDGLDHVAQQA